MEKIVQQHFTFFQNNPTIWPQKYISYSDAKAMSINTLAKHADYVCQKMYMEDPTIWRQFCDEQINSIKHFSPRELIQLGNPTSLANLAFVAINGPRPGLLPLLTECLKCCNDINV